MKSKKSFRILRTILCAFLVVSVVFASGCSKKEGKAQAKDLKIGVGNMTGNFNPFYCTTDADKSVATQIYPTIQVRNANNKLINNAGSISYEYVGDTGVKYTVTIRDDLYFSNGDKASIDDVIFWYYVLADATYDGTYSDFYLNDIQGLKEYYYDDINYKSALEKFNGNKKLINNYINENYSDGINVNEISGIKRIDNHTCTILFNSRNINAVSQINAYIVSKAFYGAEYVKGSASKIKEFTAKSCGCGAYYLTDYADSKAELAVNKYYSGETPAFRKVTYIDLEAKGKDFVNSVCDGNVDIISTNASPDVMNNLTKDNIRYNIYNESYYTAIFYSTKLNDNARKILMSVCDIYSTLEQSKGSYYSKTFLPISIRYEEGSQPTEAYYNQTTKASELKVYFSSLNAYYSGSEQDLEYTILQKYASDLSAYGIKLNITVTDDSGLQNAIKKGKADLWLQQVADGDTCDKYDYYHSGGSLNLTGLKDSEIDDLTERVRKSTGFTDRKSILSELMNAVMKKAVELPLYQLQTVTVYNTDTIDESCIAAAGEYDFTCLQVANLK